MKTDWNSKKPLRVNLTCTLLAHSNYEDGLKRCCHKAPYKPLCLLAHSNYEDGLKRENKGNWIGYWPSFGAFQLWRRIETEAERNCHFLDSYFWRIPIMKTDWNLELNVEAMSIESLLAHSNYEDGLKLRMLHVWLALSEPFGAFQLWRRIETSTWIKLD